MTGLKIGLFGGTFNPIHNAHLIIADWIRDHMELDCIYFMPTSVSPMKIDDPSILDMTTRTRMVELAIKGNSRFKLADYESEPGRVYYSVDTVRRVAAELGLTRDQLFFIIGEDNFRIVPTQWKDSPELAKLSTIIVARRFSGEPIKQQEMELEHVFVDTPAIDISSSMIRERIAKGLSIKYLVPENVEKFITEKKLYTG
ncbi:MAG: nicotinate (nicotinamide) nucleotide adenylyltransferase [bacterium]|nr:nicotinate (nicotinamide) nucleotide adenylyltransferase [bacterium]